MRRASCSRRHLVALGADRQGKAKLNLVESLSTSTGTEAADMQALASLLAELAGSAVVDLSDVDSAALAAARLRTFAKPTNLS